MNYLIVNTHDSIKIIVFFIYSHMKIEEFYSRYFEENEGFLSPTFSYIHKWVVCLIQLAVLYTGQISLQYQSFAQFDRSLET